MLRRWQRGTRKRLAPAVSGNLRGGPGGASRGRADQRAVAGVQSSLGRSDAGDLRHAAREEPRRCARQQQPTMSRGARPEPHRERIGPPAIKSTPAGGPALRGQDQAGGAASGRVGRGGSRRAGSRARDAPGVAALVEELARFYRGLWLARHQPFGLEVIQMRLAGQAGATARIGVENWGIPGGRGSDHPRV